MTEYDAVPTEEIAVDATPRVNDGFVGRLIDLLTRPSRLADNIGFAPRWWQPLLLVFILIFGFAYLTLPISGPEQMEMMRDSKLMSMVPEADWQQMYDDALDKSAGQLALESVGAGFTTLFMVLVFSFVLGFFARMSGGKGTIWQSVGVGTWAAVLPFGLASVVKLPLVLVTESAFQANIGLAALLPDGDPSSPLYQILMTYGDLFTWWGLVVMIIGFERVHGLSRGSAAATVLLPWLLMAAIPLGISLLMM